MADWVAIKTEYITTQISQRALAEKHRVTLRDIARHSKEENWVDKRTEYRNKMSTKCQQKTAEKISEAESDVAAIKARMDKKLWALIEQAAEGLTVESEVNPADLRRVVQCYVDMRGVPEDSRESMDQHNELIAALKEAVKRED